jgi:hypothetical protein
MVGMLHFATLVVTTLLAVAAAVGLDWALLRLMFVLMRPATASHNATRTQTPAGTVRLASGAAQLARAYASHR